MLMRNRKPLWLCATALLFALAPAMAQDAPPTLGALTLAGLTDVCVPVIERGEGLAEMAGRAGFKEVTGDDRAALGGAPGMSWWMFEFADAVLVVGRNLEEAGSACQIAASAPHAQMGSADIEIGRWATASSRGFEQIGAPASANARDRQWFWERAAGGSVQRLQLAITKHKDGTGSATLLYGPLPPKAR